MPTQQLPGISLFYEEIGGGFPVLFLHSAYSRGILAFSGQIQPFSHGYHGYYPDFRGHGRTRSDSPEWNTPMIAKDMAAFMQAQGMAQAHLVGYSLGGGVALHLAAERPELVRSIITIGCGGQANAKGADDFEPEAIEAAGNTALIDRMQVMHGEASGGDWRIHMRQSAKDWREYPNLTEAQWKRLTMPMLLIGGEKDGFAAPEHLLAMQAKCPQAEIYVIPGAGHRPHMPMEQGREVTQRMLAFLHSVEDRTS